MRDIALTLFLFGSVPFILWRPAIGVFLWVWVSLMSPHRLTWGFAYDLRFAYLIAIATLLGVLFSREPKRLPLTPVTVVLLLMILWMNVTTLFAFDTALALPMWERVMKIQFMVFVALYLLHSKQHVQVLIWVLAGSVAFYGVKGGLFTLRGTGENIVYGPAGSFIEENNALALALVMTIPLLRYLQLQAARLWIRWGLVGAMVLCGLSILGSHSRGALLGVIAMLMVFWLKSRNKLVTGFVLVLLVPFAIGLMPEKWDDRMRSIQTYEQDASSMGRINSWQMAVNLAMDRPLVGGGFEVGTPSLFDRYAPDPSDVRSAHSIYFQILGEHGFVGLALFLLLWALVWWNASWIIKHSRNQSESRWASDLARMIQVSLVGYAVGGAFLNLAYYDVPYNMLVALVLTRILVEKEIKSVNREAGGLSVGPEMNAGRVGSRRVVSRSRYEPKAGTDRYR
jgi:probable O-glycosylation ligase (exosortase A-associated)